MDLVRAVPTPVLVGHFTELAEGVLPCDGFADWPGAHAYLPEMAREHPAWSVVTAYLEGEPGAVRFLEPEGFQTSTGLGFEHVSAADLLDGLLLATWQRMDITGQRGNQRRVGAAARSVLVDLCALSSGQAVEVPACILWDGPKLDADRRLHGVFGSLRWEEYVPPPYVEAGPYRGLMLYTKLPVQVMDPDAAERVTDFYGSANVTHRALDRITTQMRLALLEDGLVEEPDSPYESTSGPPARVVLADISTPWDSGHLVVEAYNEFGTAETIINPRAMERRFDFYASNWSPAVDLAGRRLAASADDARREDDALVDAVTAWESLLGSDQEISFRLAASLARLLRTEVPEREKLYRELKGIYSLRSKIVHGTKDLTIDDGERLRSQRLRATSVGARTLRILLGERRDLLDQKTDARSLRLLLE